MAELLASTGAMSGLLCVLLAVFLAGSKGRLALANRFLAGFLILTAIDVAGLVGLVLPPAVGDALAFRTPLAFLQMPFFYAYVVTLCLPARVFRPHFFSAAVLLGLTVLDILVRTEGRFPAWGEAGLHLQFYVYLGLSTLALLRFQTGLKQNRSTDQAVQLRWLWAVILTSFFAHGLVLIRTVASWQTWPVPWASLQLANSLLALAILCGLTLTALLRPSLFQALDADETARAKRTVPKEALNGLASRAQAYLSEHQPHLEPDLTLKTLARRMGVGERDLSHALNHSLRRHFFDFINQARIEHAQALIADDLDRKKTLLDIAYASGFNSKSSFNTAFKKHAGQTPSAYRAAQRAS
jgi:AraC-like DNA-binding protein